MNGGQTTASLHRARKQDGSDLEGDLVPAKIIKVRTANLDAMVAAVRVPRTARTRFNPRISPRMIRSTSPSKTGQQYMASGSEGRWFYERARGSYGAAELKASFKACEKRRFANETPKERKFSKTDLAKYLNAWEGRLT